MAVVHALRSFFSGGKEDYIMFTPTRSVINSFFLADRARTWTCLNDITLYII